MRTNERFAPLASVHASFTQQLKWERVIVALNGSREKVNEFNTEKHNWASSKQMGSCSGLQRHADEVELWRGM